MAVCGRGKYHIHSASLYKRVLSPDVVKLNYLRYLFKISANRASKKLRSLCLSSKVTQQFPTRVSLTLHWAKSKSSDTELIRKKVSKMRKRSANMPDGISKLNPLNFDCQKPLIKIITKTHFRAIWKLFKFCDLFPVSIIKSYIDNLPRYGAKCFTSEKRQKGVPPAF